MTSRVLDIARWSRADQFRFFRGYDRPHFAVTSRVDVTRLVKDLKPQGVSPYRACLFAIGAGLHAVPELRTRFRGDRVTEYGRIDLSMTVPTPSGDFRYAYVPFDPDFVAFDREAAARIESAREQESLNANAGEREDLAYLSCMPWLDYTSINNAMPGPNDCIPRVSWGKFVGQAGRWDMAMTIEVHHALVDGRQVGLYFDAVKSALDQL